MMVYVRFPKRAEKRVVSGPYPCTIKMVENTRKTGPLPKKQKAINHNLIMTKRRVRNRKGIIHLVNSRKRSGGTPPVQCKETGLVSNCGNAQ